MEALKKTGVAAMIMVICIVLAILLGEVRSTTYKNAESGNVAVTTERNGVGKLIYNWSTYGTIQNQVEKGLNVITDKEDDDDDGGFSIGKLIGVLIIIAIVAGIFKNK